MESDTISLLYNSSVQQVHNKSE